MKRNVLQQGYRINKQMRRHRNKHNSFVLWLTGLSGSGKSTIADSLDLYFYEQGFGSYVLDGDNIRLGLNKNLGFSPNDRTENIRRVGEVSKLFIDAGLICIAAFISPFLQDREQVRSLFEEGEFIEVYVKCPLEVCEQRDPKGLYRKARIGEIKDFTGISSPYQETQEPEILIETNRLSLEESVAKITRYIESRNIGF